MLLIKKEWKFPLLDEHWSSFLRRLTWFQLAHFWFSIFFISVKCSQLVTKLVVVLATQQHFVAVLQKVIHGKCACFTGAISSLKHLQQWNTRHMLIQLEKRLVCKYRYIKKRETKTAGLAWGINQLEQSKNIWPTTLPNVKSVFLLYLMDLCYNWVSVSLNLFANATLQVQKQNKTKKHGLLFCSWWYLFPIQGVFLI